MLPKKLYSVILMITSLFMGQNLYANGYLFVAPQSVTLTQQSPISQLHLVNKSDKTKTYKLRPKSYFMNEKGTLIEKDFSHSAHKNIRYAPRRVTLGAGEDQYINISARFLGMAQDDERHIHLEFTEVENSAENEAPTDEKILGQKAAFSVGAAYGVAVPIFIEKGKPQGLASLEKAVVKKKNNKNIALTLDLNRTGSATAYARAYVNHVASSGKVTPIGVPTLIKIYREADHIQKTLQLTAPKGVTFSSSMLEVTLKEYHQDRKKEEKLLSTVKVKL